MDDVPVATVNYLVDVRRVAFHLRDLIPDADRLVLFETAEDNSKSVPPTATKMLVKPVP